MRKKSSRKVKQLADFFKANHSVLLIGPVPLQPQHKVEAPINQGTETANKPVPIDIFAVCGLHQVSECFFLHQMNGQRTFHHQVENSFSDRLLFRVRMFVFSCALEV